MVRPHILPRQTHLSGAFTLIEIMIVVVILGVLAAIVIPSFGQATEDSKTGALQITLWRLRTQLEIYKNDHKAYPTLAGFSDQMTLASDQAGNTAAQGTAGYPLGPYMLTMPLNPMSNTRDVGSGAIGSSAWYYNPVSGQFLANDSVLTNTY